MAPGDFFGSYFLGARAAPGRPRLITLQVSGIYEKPLSYCFEW